MSKSAFYALTT